MEFYHSLTDYFESQLRSLRCSREVRAYIVSILSQYRFSEQDLSKVSLTVKFSEAKSSQDFASFQRVGDYLFFANSFSPESLSGASKDYYYALGQLSYYSCYRLLNRSWRLYEELADKFIPLTESSRHIIRASAVRSDKSDPFLSEP